MTPRWQPVFLVAWREIRERTRSRALAISTLALVAIIVAGIIASGSKDETPQLHASVTGPTPTALTGALHDAARANGARIDLRRYPTVAAGQKAVRDGKTGVLIVGGKRLVWKSEPNVRLAAVVAGALQRVEWSGRAAALGLTPAQAARLVAPAQISERRLEAPNRDQEHERDAAAVAGALLLVMVLLYGTAVAQGVGQEKGGRIMEVLLSRVRSQDLLAGKVLGIGLVGLGQMLLAVGAGAVAIVAVDTVDVPSAIPATLASTLLWFALGYAFYSVAFAAVGALVSRVEDVPAATAPLTWLLTVAYVAAMVAGDQPGAWYIHLASFLPVTAPLVMPVRVAVSTVAPWEIVLAVGLTIAATYALVRLAGAIYSGALLRSGARPHLRDVWRAARAG
jgi:ABC-2 type transport system permease protein